MSGKIPIDLQWEKWCDHSSAFIFEGSYLFLQVTRTTIKAWMSLNFCQIQELTTELAALECLKNQCLHFFLIAFDLILFKLAIYLEFITILARLDNRQHNYLLLTIQKIPKFGYNGENGVSGFSCLFTYLLSRGLFKMF